MLFNALSRLSRAPASLLLPVLAGCAATPDTYPSLAIRDVERVTGTADPVAAAPYVPPATPQGVLDRVEQLRLQAQAADAAFQREEQANRGAISGLGGASEGSDAWARGIAALAELEGRRSQTMVHLADLDRLFVDAAVEGAEVARIGAARDEVAALVSRQDDAIARLAGQ